MSSYGGKINKTNIFCLKLFKSHPSPLVNSTANIQDTVMPALSKAKQLLNEPSYLVMASNVKCAHFPLLSCVCHQICLSSSQIKSALNQ